MKYDSNLITRNHWGGGETQVYDIGEYRVVAIFATGSSVSVYEKEKLPIAMIQPNWADMIWGYLGVKSLVSGMFFMEPLDECIDRLLSEIKHPHQLVWFEKVEGQDPNKYYCNTNNVRYTTDNSLENIKRIENSPSFIQWYKEPEWLKELKEKYGPQ